MIICSPQYGLRPDSSAGGEVYDEKILKGLAQKGDRIEIILPYKKPYDTFQKNWNVHHLPLPFVHFSYLFNLVIIPQLVSIHKKTGFRVLRIHSPYYAGIGAWLFKRIFAPEVRLVATYFHFEKKLIFKIIDALFVRKWDQIITISQATKNILTGKYKIPEKKITLAYPGISEEYQPAPKDPEIIKKFGLKNKKTLVFCGMLIKRKNVGFLLDVIGALDPADIVLVIVGDGPERKALENRVQKAGLQRNVIFAGQVSQKEKIKILQTADVFLFPSLMEGFGFSPLEAMACGIPTIVSNRGSLPEVVGSGGIILPLEIGTWKQAVQKLFEKKGLKERRGRKAISRSKKFRWQDTINAVQKTCRKMDSLPPVKNPKINIFYQIKESPWGGGNQFLKALKKEFSSKGIYADDPEDADVIIFNSFDQLGKIVRFKKLHPSKIFIHRVDGPIYLIRGKDKAIDRLIFGVNQAIADGTVFQSRWCREKSRQQGMEPNNFETVIYNAPDSHIFNRQDKTPFPGGSKVKLVAVSWSSNWNKGFKYYEYLDNNLDWSKYEMTFVGRSPIKFANIKMAGQLTSSEIAGQLKKHDIFITASKDEPCSNALIEALSCGLPSLALDSGGNPELAGRGGELFENAREIPGKLELIINNYGKYQAMIPQFSISQAARQYADFTESVIKGVSKNYSLHKRLTLCGKIKIRIAQLHWLIQRIITKLKLN